MSSSSPTLSTFLRVSKHPFGVNLSVIGRRKILGFSTSGGVAEPVFPAADDELPLLLFEDDFSSGEAPAGPPGGAPGVAVSAIPVFNTPTDNVVYTVS